MTFIILLLVSRSAKNGDILKLRNSLTDLLVSISLLMSRMLGNSWSNLKIPLVTNAFVTTLIEPYNADPSKVVSYQTWEDASNINCSPSYGAQFGSPLSTITTKLT